MPAPIPAIHPISDLRTNLQSICDEARATQGPVILTKNGKGSLVVMDFDAYEHQQQHDRYVAALREAEIEAKYRPESMPREDVDARIKKLFDLMEA